MAGSAIELRRRLSTAAYLRIKPHFQRKNWEIVAFTGEYLVLRIERENIKFHRDRGTILDRFSLTGRGNPR